MSPSPKSQFVFASAFSRIGDFFRIFGIHIFLRYGEFVEMITMQDATVLRLALTTQFDSAGSAHYIKIGDGRFCVQWPHAIVGADTIIM